MTGRKQKPLTPTTFEEHYQQLRKDGGILNPAVAPKTYAGYPVTFGYHVKDAYGSLGYHTGEDHACPEGSLAVATSYGQVVYVAEGGGSYGAPYGNIVVIRTATGYFDYLYGHLSVIKASVGEHVVPGTLVGLTGATGNVTGPHLHYEARPAGGHFGSDIRPLYTKQKGHKPGSL